MNTNQDTTLTNHDEAFKKWLSDVKSKATQPLNYNNFLIKEAWQAATQASESEINSLKERVKELELWKNQAIAVESEWDCQSVGKALNLPLGNSIRKNILPKIAELIASNNQLREALEIAMIGGDYLPNERLQLKKVLLSTSAQSLAEHDNEVIDRCAKVADNRVYGSNAATEIRALKGK